MAPHGQRTNWGVEGRSRDSIDHRVSIHRAAKENIKNKSFPGTLVNSGATRTPERALIEYLNDDLRHQTWRNDARCKDIEDPDIFWSDGARAAINICASCPVKQQCYDYGMDTKQPYGVFGGVGARKRLSGGGPIPEASHGTKAAYKRHQDDGEYPCDRCMEWANARNQYKRKAS